jgi:hypothetical protein
MSYVYVRSEPSLWTVGHYRPTDDWEPESDHGSPEDAAARVAWLNGSHGTAPGEQTPAAPVPDPTEALREVWALAYQGVPDTGNPGADW